MTRIYFRDAVAAIVVFDVTAKETLERAGKWVEDLRAEAPNGCIICLTGNKIDLEEKREISTEDMIQFAQKHELSMVFETSAKTNYGMDDMIYEIAVEIDHQRKNFEHIYSKRSASVALHKGQPHPLKNGSMV